MKKKYLALLLLFQVILFSITTGQAVGIGTSTVSGFPLSTLDISGTFGSSLWVNGVSSTTNNLSTVIYNPSVTGTLATIALPSISRRIYIITNAAIASGSNKSWAITSFQNLKNVATSTILAGTSVMLVYDGTNWLQIL